MVLTARAKRDRRRGIGASEIAAVCGYDEWTTGYNVWLDKVYEKEDEEEDEAQEEGPIHLGNILEEALIKDCAKKFNLPKMKRNQVRVGANKIMRATLDGLSINGHRVGAEAKVSSLDDGWGEQLNEDGTRSDLVPKRVLFQTSQQIYAAELDYSYVVALLVHRGRLVERFYLVERNDEFIRYLCKEGEAFWKLVTSRTPPVDSEPTVRAIREIKRATGSVKFLGDDELALGDYTQWAVDKAGKLAAEKKAKASQARFLKHLGDSELGDLGPDVAREVEMGKRSRTNYGTSDKYADPCDKCGVGKSVSNWRQPSDRKRRA